MTDTTRTERVISGWTAYSPDQLTRFLTGNTHIGLGAAERITEEVESREPGTVLRFTTNTEVAGLLASGLGLDGEPVSERTWSVRKRITGPGSAATYRLALHKIRDGA